MAFGAAALMDEVEPFALNLPPRDRRGGAEAIAEAHARCEASVAAKRDDETVEIADSLSLFMSDGFVSNGQLIDVRLWKVEALSRLGRGREALEALSWVERFHGASWRTRMLLAKLRFFFGDLQGCVDACADAMIALPLEKRPGKTYRELCVLRTEAICLQGRHDEAMTFLIDATRTLVPTYDGMAALRRCASTPALLERMFNFLAPHFSYPGHRARHALLHYSVACRDLGLLERAALAARQRFLIGLDIVRHGQRQDAEKQDWTREAAVALADLKQDLAEIGVEYFLISGTLLGCVRDGTVLSHDKDIDVGVLTDVAAERIRATLAGSGRFRVRGLTTDKLVQVQHANGVVVDVFLHWRENGLIYHEGQKTRWWNTDFELRDVVFLGAAHKIPANADLYLIENYGDWTVPQPEFETFVDTPNMIVHDQDHMIWYYYTRLHDYYFLGKTTQLQKVFDALKKLGVEDYVVSVAIDRIKSAATDEGASV